MIINSLTVLIAIIALLLIIAVLIQNPKGGGIDSTYGSGANQMFGAARSADAIEKITWYLAAALFVLCIASYFFISKGTAANEIQLLSNPKG
jgi:preprotein translocase subunit SecG